MATVYVVRHLGLHREIVPRVDTKVLGICADQAAAEIIVHRFLADRKAQAAASGVTPPEWVEGALGWHSSDERLSIDAFEVKEAHQLFREFDQVEVVKPKSSEERMFEGRQFTFLRYAKGTGYAVVRCPREHARNPGDPREIHLHPESLKLLKIEGR